MDFNLATLKGIELAGRKALNPIREGEGNSGSQWLGRDGAAVKIPWIQALILEGRCFSAHTGALATGVGEGTAAVLKRPEFLLSIPSGTIVMPFHIGTQVQVPAAIATTNITETIWMVDRTQAWDATGTATNVACGAAGFLNLRTDNPKTSVCTFEKTFTADITATPVESIDLVRKEFVYVITTSGMIDQTQELCWDAPQAGPMIVGPAMIHGYVGCTTAALSFMQLWWAEWSKTDLGL